MGNHYWYSISLGNKAETIGNYALSGNNRNSSFTSFVIPDSVKTIGERAFQSWGYLKTLTIGSGVTKIGYEAFTGTALTSVTFKNTSGWKYGNSYSGATNAITVTDPSNNATYLKSTYVSKYWVRN